MARLWFASGRSGMKVLLKLEVWKVLLAELSAEASFSLKRLPSLQYALSLFLSSEGLEEQDENNEELFVLKSNKFFKAAELPRDIALSSELTRLPNKPTAPSFQRLCWSSEQRADRFHKVPQALATTTMLEDCR